MKYTLKCQKFERAKILLLSKTNAHVLSLNNYLKNDSYYNLIYNWTNMRVQRTRTKQLRTPLTTTLGHPKSMQCNFNSCSFNYKSNYSGTVTGVQRSHLSCVLIKEWHHTWHRETWYTRSFSFFLWFWKRLISPQISSHGGNTKWHFLHPVLTCFTPKIP